jgi:hypothetical protein
MIQKQKLEEGLVVDLSRLKSDGQVDFWRELSDG